MAYNLPVFNLNVRIWRFGNATSNPPDVVAVGNLAAGKRTGTLLADYAAGSGRQGGMWLLVPKGTDIQDAKNGNGPDTVEVPSGTGRFYQAHWVDDLGAGFTNEHRFAELVGQSPWPTPFPPGAPLPSPPSPGVSCGTAGTFALGTTYTYNHPGPSDDWFKLPGQPAGLYTIWLTAISGLLASVLVYRGPCSALVLLNTTGPTTSHVQVTLPSPQDIVLQAADSPLGDPARYSLLVTSP